MDIYSTKSVIIYTDNLEMDFFLGIRTRLARNLHNINFIDKVATGQAGSLQSPSPISREIANRFADRGSSLLSLFSFLSSLGTVFLILLHSKYQSAESAIIFLRMQKKTDIRSIFRGQFSSSQ